ncbi:MAG: GntR family transcriptional regulator [Roseicyclus sp.]
MPEWEVDRASPLPLFLQIRQKLVALIDHWPDPQRRFHTDAELAARFGVTKATVRQALSDLAAAGLIQRRRGSSTYIQRARYLEFLRPALDIDRQYAKARSGMKTCVLDLAERKPTVAERDALLLGPRALVTAIRRLRTLAHLPVAIDDRVLETGLARRAGFDSATAAESIVNRLRATVPLGRASWEISAARAGAVDCNLLQVAPDDPLLVRALVYHGTDGTPLMMGETRHSSDIVHCGFDMDFDGTGGETGLRGDAFPERPLAQGRAAE